MSVELVRNFPEGNLDNAIKLMQSAAEFYDRKVEAWLKGHPDVDPNATGFEHCDAAAYGRYREVYQATAHTLEEVLLKHRRNLVRAGNPFFADYTDEQVDAILAQQD